MFQNPLDQIKGLTPVTVDNPEELDKVGAPETDEKQDKLKVQVKKALQELHRPVSMQELVEYMYGEFTPTYRNRIAYHLRHMVDTDQIKAVGVNQNRRYFSPDVTPPPGVKTPKRQKKGTTIAKTLPTSSPVAIGAMFELVGVIKGRDIVRSIDTHELYRLEKL